MLKVVIEFPWWWLWGWEYVWFSYEPPGKLSDWEAVTPGRQIQYYVNKSEIPQQSKTKVYNSLAIKWSWYGLRLPSDISDSSETEYHSITPSYQGTNEELHTFKVKCLFYKIRLAIYMNTRNTASITYNNTYIIQQYTSSQTSPCLHGLENLFQWWSINWLVGQLAMFS